MKLTAPPPGTAPEPVPEMPPAESQDAAAAPLSPPPPYQKPPEKPATWPTWFGPADFALAAMVLALAFLGASFAARNSDVWVHLAAGQRLSTGEYKLGTDPFSFSAAERTWVNHSWLFDYAAYSLYSGSGFTLVFIKALLVAVSFLLIFSLRRPGQPFLPWALLSTLAIVASVNFYTLRPYILSLLFLAGTLVLVFQLPRRPGSWALPAAVGVIFCLWSNLDSWFVLGPVTLLLLLVGSTISMKLWPTASEDELDPLPTLPDSTTLGKALAVGVLACMVNPHHIGVWEIPYELMGAGAGESDPRIRALFNSPLSAVYWRSENLGLNAGGIAFAILLLSGLYAAFLSSLVGRFLGRAAEVDPLPLPHTLLWLGFAALSLLTLFALPFFALVTVPLVAARWNLVSSRLQLSFWSEQRTRLLLTGSAAGRVLSFAAILLLGLASVPGWLHPPASAWWEWGLASPAGTRRLEWKIEPDAELRRCAEWLNEARTSNQLPADAKGFLTSIDLANHCAWFAPREKVFINGRFGFHRPEFAEFVKVRKGFGLIGEDPDLRDVEDSLKTWKTSYVGLAILRSEADRDRFRLSAIEQNLWTDWETWSPWYLNGRSVILGWRASKASGEESFSRLELNPEHLAFGPNVERLPPNQTEPPQLIQSALDEWFQPRQPTPAGAEEALAWLGFKARRRDQNVIATRTAALLRLNQPGIATPVIAPAMFEAMDETLASQRRLGAPPSPPDGSFRAATILALRAARRAIAESPDHPDGYYALAQVLADRDLPMSDAERSLAQVTAYRQCLLRLPTPARFRRNFYLSSPSDVTRSLWQLYLGQRFRTGEYQGLRIDVGSVGELALGGVLYQLPATGTQPSRIVRILPTQEAIQSLPKGSTQIAAGLYILPLDLARQVMTLNAEYVKLELPEGEQRAGYLRGLEAEGKSLDSYLRTQTDQYRRQAERATRVRERVPLAIQFGLVGEALSQLKSSELDVAKEFGDAGLQIATRIIALEMAVGNLEEAATDLAVVRDEINSAAAGPGGASERIQSAKAGLADLEFQKLVLEGNYGEAGRNLESRAGAQVGLGTLLAELEKAKIDPRSYKNFETVIPRMAALGVAWPIIPMLGIPPVPTGLPLNVVSNYWAGFAQWTHFRRFSEARDMVAQKMNFDADFYYRRGILALFEGDIAGAKKRFEAVNQTAPPGWDLPGLEIRQIAPYLKLIERGSKP